jgi:hypothetical protein
MCKYKQFLQLYLKHTPETNHQVTKHLFEKAGFDRLTDRHVSPLTRYI